MQQSSSLSSKLNNTTISIPQQHDKKNCSTVNWISVINFLENQYTKSTLKQKQWFLERKILSQEISKLKSQLTAVERLNINLNNRIKLLQYALRKQKLSKQPNANIIIEKFIEETKTVQEIEKYFQKNGLKLDQKQKNLEQNIHKQFLTKVLDEVGLNFSKIRQKCRKISIASVDAQKMDRKQTAQSFQTLINELNKVKVSSKIKINGHLDAIRGMFSTKSVHSKSLLVSVSEDCLVKFWNIDPKINNLQEPIQPVACLREHTGQLFTIDGGQTNQNNDLILFTAGTEELVNIWYSKSKQKVQELKCIGSFPNEKNLDIQKSNESENQIIWNLKYKEKKLLTSASDGIVRLFSTSIENIQMKFSANIKLLNEFYEKGYIQTVLEWVGDRGFLAGCSNSPRIHLWDIQRSKIAQRYLYEIDKPKEDKLTNKKQSYFSNSFQINSMKYISELKTIYTGCEDRAIRIFSYSENKLIKKLDAGINDSINCIELYKNNFIAAGCQNGTIKVWDRRTYRLLIDQQCHKTKYDEGILCMTATEEGIFTGGADGLINFYTI